MEVLIAVGILAVLIGLAVPGAVSYSRRLTLANLDDSAHALYLAAQNSLSAMKNAGKDITALSDSAAGDDVITIDKESKGASALLPAGSVEESLLENYFVVKIDPGAGTVVSVWYWENKNTDPSSFPRDIASLSFDSRLKNNVMAGYYGGDNVNRPSIGEAPPISLVLQDKNTLSFEATAPCADPAKPAYFSVTLTGSDGIPQTIISNYSVTGFVGDLYRFTFALNSKNGALDKSDLFGSWTTVDGGALSIGEGEPFLVTVKLSMANCLPSYAKFYIN